MKCPRLAQVALVDLDHNSSSLQSETIPKGPVKGHAPQIDFGEAIKTHVSLVRMSVAVSTWSAIPIKISGTEPN